MVLRVNIDQIEPATRDWICKVQIVEIGRPRESLDKKCTFQNLILEDEEVRNAKLKQVCRIEALCQNNQIFQQMGVFYVEAEMAILDEFQDFCVLECSGCKQKKRTKDRKDFHCPKCNRKTALVPRCSFQIDLIDNTATTTASISAELGEKILSMTAEDIFDTTCTKRQSLSLTHVHEMLSNKVFAIQLRKSSWASSNTTNATLSILSYTEK
ncbi:hypothetical protein H5410_065078 [Solanum commersonii]|uniref:Replication factor A C-terminal domain-containing protein n=1 Tax=Solanum commersonii TaxID=4109 RepID=A0A9J5VXI8_SOLCO|nr:hypothetical protein H5410_065078 [Solanum commersonii]